MTEKTSRAKRILHAIDRGTLVTMNPPRPYLPLRGTDHGVSTTSNTGTGGSTAGPHNLDVLEETPMSTIELDRELEALREATVWQLNSALESGWDDATQGIADSYADSQRSLISRWRRVQAA